MIKQPFRIGFLLLSLLFVMISCSTKEDLCSLPKADEALKEALVERMKRWEDNAGYIGIEDFETRINQVIDDLSITENNYYPGKTDEGSCHCQAKIQFEDHDAFLAAITEPVEKVKAEEHPLNTPYLRMERKINYVDNDGFKFFYVLKKEENGSLKASQTYPLAMQPQVDTAGGMLWEYFEYLRAK